MTKPILIAVAWPYANGDLHLGHLAGTFLPADILARYHRLQGNQVLMVSGSDAHGTPITIAADNEGISPRQLFEH
jgi:methionyl-tRNA synthetase